MGLLDHLLVNDGDPEPLPHTTHKTREGAETEGKIKLPKDSISPECRGRQRFFKQDIKENIETFGLCWNLEGLF